MTTEATAMDLPGYVHVYSGKVRELYAGEIARINPMIDVKYQRIKRVFLADREPSMERGELTPTAKIVRQCVFDSFKHEIQKLFEREAPTPVIEILDQQVHQDQGIHRHQSGEKAVRVQFPVPLPQQRGQEETLGDAEEEGDVVDGR